MKRNKIAIWSLAALLICTSGVLFAKKMHSHHEHGPKKMKVTIVKDNNGELTKTEEVIEIQSKEDVHAYLKEQGVDPKELTFYPKRGRHPHGKVWVYNASGKEVHHARVMMINSEIEDTKDGDVRKVVIKTELNDEENGDGVEKHENVRIIKEVDDDGNVSVQKWVNGELVEGEEADNVKITEIDGETTIEVKDDAGENTIIKTKTDEKGNVVILQSKDGEQFEAIDANKVHRKKHHHGPHGFAAQSEDGSIMVFGNMVNEDPKKQEKSEMKNDLQVEALKFYPNPSEGNFSISFSSDSKEPVSITIKDMQGKEILQREFNHAGGSFKQEIELKDAAPGMYIFEIQQGGKTNTQKLLVN